MIMIQPNESIVDDVDLGSASFEYVVDLQPIEKKESKERLNCHDFNPCIDSSEVEISLSNKTDSRNHMHKKGNRAVTSTRNLRDQTSVSLSMDDCFCIFDSIDSMNKIKGSKRLVKTQRSKTQKVNKKKNDLISKIDSVNHMERNKRKVKSLRSRVSKQQQDDLIDRFLTNLNIKAHESKHKAELSKNESFSHQNCFDVVIDVDNNQTKPGELQVLTSSSVDSIKDLLKRDSIQDKVKPISSIREDDNITLDITGAIDSMNRIQGSKRVIKSCRSKRREENEKRKETKGLSLQDDVIVRVMNNFERRNSKCMVFQKKNLF